MQNFPESHSESNRAFGMVDNAQRPRPNPVAAINPMDVHEPLLRNSDLVDDDDDDSY